MKRYQKLLLAFITLIPFVVCAENVESVNGCKTKLVQMLIPDWPNANYQGYSIVSFNINEDGEISQSIITVSYTHLTRPTKA